MASLIVYYTQSGNTEKVAEYIKGFTGGDLLRIGPTEAPGETPEERMKANRVIMEDFKNGKLPEISGVPENLDKYDTIYIGSPNWGNTAVPWIFAFTAKYDFTGKKVAVFCTHGTRGGYKVFADIEATCKNAEAFIPGFGCYSQVMDEKTETEVKFWLQGNGLIESERR